MKTLLAAGLAFASLVGMASASPLVPTCTLTATPSVIWPGEAVTLTWDTTGAKHVLFSPEFGSGLQTRGSVVVRPTSPVLYKMVALSGNEVDKENGQYAFCRATVSVRSNTAP